MGRVAAWFLVPTLLKFATPSDLPLKFLEWVTLFIQNNASWCKHLKKKQVFAKSVWLAQNRLRGTHSPVELQAELRLPLTEGSVGAVEVGQVLCQHECLDCACLVSQWERWPCFREALWALENGTHEGQPNRQPDNQDQGEGAFKSKTQEQASRGWYGLESS